MSKESINYNDNFDESSETNENKREKLGQILNKVRESALKKFDETEDLNSALKEAIRDLNERFSITENKEISKYEEALLLSFNQTVHGRDREEIRRKLQDKFEEDFKPLIIKMSNWEEAMVTAVHKNVNPEFKEGNNGIFLLVEKENKYLLLPRYLTNRYELPSLEACYEIETEISSNESPKLVRVEKPAVCSRAGKGWIL